MSQVVKVVDQKDGLNGPVFLIEADGRFYLTLAVWEYDDADTDGLSEKERRGVEHVRTLHADGCKDGHHKAIKVTADVGVFAQHTNPSHP